MKKLIYTFGVIIFLLSRSISANAVFHDILEQVNNGLAITVAAMHLNYIEDNIKEDPAVPKNIEDYGNAYGIMLNFRNIFYEKIYAELIGEYSTGKIQYDGLHKDPPYKPIKSKISQDFANVDMKLGALLIDTQYFQLIPYGGFGFHYWKNSSVSRYYNYKAIVGGKVNVALFDELALSPYFNIGTTLGARNRSKDIIGKVKFNLGRKAIREFGLEINYRWDNEIFLTGMVSHTHFEYGRAESQYRIEPNSKTNELRFGIGIRIGFV